MQPCNRAAAAMTAVGIAAWSLVGFLAATGLQATLRCDLLTTVGTGTPGQRGIPEVATAALFAALAWRIGAKPDLIAYSWLVTAAVPLAMLDWKNQRLPTKLLWPIGLVLAALFTLAAVIDGEADPLARGFAGMLMIVTFHGCIYFIRPGQLGGGDVRLSGILGLALGWAGWTTILIGTLLAWSIAAVAVLALYVLGRLRADRRIPLGPFLIIGALTAVLTDTTAW